MAIFVHDYPVQLESHPLPRMVKHSLKNNRIFLSDGLIPKVKSYESGCILFSQSVYSNFFNDKSKTNLSFDEAKQIVEDEYQSEKISKLFENLDSLDEFYKLRLVCVVNIDATSSTKNFKLQQNIACRYISISGFEKKDISVHDNMDFRGVRFFGKMIETPFSLIP